MLDTIGDWVAAVLILAVIGFTIFVLVTIVLMIRDWLRGGKISELLQNDANRVAAKTLFFVLCLAMVIGGIIVLTNDGFFEPKQSPFDPVALAAKHKTRAVVECEDKVKDRLKAPATAVFGTTSEYNSDFKFMGSDAAGYLVHSSVDSQNSFGALIRAHFVCSVRFIGTNQGIEKWQAEVINFIE